MKWECTEKRDKYSEKWQNTAQSVEGQNTPQNDKILHKVAKYSAKWGNTAKMKW